MSILIKNVRGKNLIEYDTGAFDAWCVYLTRLGRPRYPPRDEEYFSKLKSLGNTYGHQKIYDDFVACYSLTNGSIEPKVLTLITDIADTYDVDAEEIDIWFTVIYAGMVAEENKAYAKLKKKIKRLGMHQVLVEGLAPDYAANYSKGKNWQDLDAIMKQKGF